MDTDKITLFELGEDGGIVKVTEFTGIKSATITWNGREYNIPVEMALSGMQSILEMDKEAGNITWK
jgi:hypothetical protein